MLRAVKPPTPRQFLFSPLLDGRYVRFSTLEKKITYDEYKARSGRELLEYRDRSSDQRLEILREGYNEITAVFVRMHERRAKIRVQYSKMLAVERDMREWVLPLTTCPLLAEEHETFAEEYEQYSKEIQQLAIEHEILASCIEAFGKEGEKIDSFLSEHMELVDERKKNHKEFHLNRQKLFILQKKFVNFFQDASLPSSFDGDTSNHFFSDLEDGSALRFDTLEEKQAFDGTIEEMRREMVEDLSSVDPLKREIIDFFMSEKVKFLERRKMAYQEFYQWIGQGTTLRQASNGRIPTGSSTTTLAGTKRRRSF